MGNKDKGKRITWNGGTVIHGAGGSRWRWCRGSRLWWQTLVLLLLSSASLCCLFPLFCFLLAVFLPQFQWLSGGVVCANRAATGGEEENWLSYAEDATLVSLYFLLLPPLFCLCFGWLVSRKLKMMTILVLVSCVPFVLLDFLSVFLHLLLFLFFFLVSGSTGQGTAAMDVNCCWVSLASVPLFLSYRLPMRPSSPPSPSVSFYSTCSHLFSLSFLSLFFSFFFLPPLCYLIPPLFFFSYPLLPHALPLSPFLPLLRSPLYVPSPLLFIVFLSLL